MVCLPCPKEILKFIIYIMIRILSNLTRTEFKQPHFFYRLKSGKTRSSQGTNFITTFEHISPF